MRIVIIGNGVAGMEAALTLREREPNWSITLISEESDHFFSRTALMWVMCGQMSYRDIEPHERDVYARLNIGRVRARALGLDTTQRVVKMAGNHDDVPYDQLLIACGSKPRPAPWPGADTLGVGHFVSLQDLAWLEREIHGHANPSPPPRPDAHLAFSDAHSPYRMRPTAAEKRGRVAQAPSVVGGGLIGIEAVEVMVAAKRRPQFFIRDEWFWPLAINRDEAQWVTERMREHGVEVHLQHNLQHLESDTSHTLARVHTDQGSYDTDLMVVAIGVIPNTDWLKGSDIQQHERGGIVVDSQQRSSAEGVFAAGDCAIVTWFDGKQRPEQLWYTSRDQGRTAARVMLGDDVNYQRGTFYNSAKLMDIEYTTVGLVNMKLADEGEWYFEERDAVRSTTRVVTQQGRVVGFNMLGRRWDHEVLTRWIHEHRSLSYVLNHIGEASFDTEFVPPLHIPHAARQVAA